MQKGTGTDSGLGWQSKNEGQELEQEAERKKEYHEQYNRSSWIQHCPSTLFKHPHNLFQLVRFGFSDVPNIPDSQYYLFI